MSQTSTVVVGPQMFPLAKNHITVVVSVSESETSLPKASAQPQQLCQCLKPVCLRCQHSHSSHVSVCLRHLHSHSSHVSGYILVSEPSEPERWDPFLITVIWLYDQMGTEQVWNLHHMIRWEQSKSETHITWSDGNRASLKPTSHDQMGTEQVWNLHHMIRWEQSKSETYITWSVTVLDIDIMVCVFPQQLTVHHAVIGW